MKKRVADIIMDVLTKNNITDAFSVVGGGAMHLNNAFSKCEKIDKYGSIRKDSGVMGTGKEHSVWICSKAA